MGRPRLDVLKSAAVGALGVVVFTGFAVVAVGAAVLVGAALLSLPFGDFRSSASFDPPWTVAYYTSGSPWEGWLRALLMAAWLALVAWWSRHRLVDLLRSLAKGLEDWDLPLRRDKIAAAALAKEAREESARLYAEEQSRAAKSRLLELPVQLALELVAQAAGGKPWNTVVSKAEWDRRDEIGVAAVSRLRAEGVDVDGWASEVLDKDDDPRFKIDVYDITSALVAARESLLDSKRYPTGLIFADRVREVWDATAELAAETMRALDANIWTHLAWSPHREFAQAHPYVFGDEPSDGGLIEGPDGAE